MHQPRKRAESVDASVLQGGMQYTAGRADTQHASACTKGRKWGSCGVTWPSALVPSPSLRTSVPLSVSCRGRMQETDKGNHAHGGACVWRGRALGVRMAVMTRTDPSFQKGNIWPGVDTVHLLLSFAACRPVGSSVSHNVCGRQGRRHDGEKSTRLMDRMQPLFLPHPHRPLCSRCVWRPRFASFPAISTNVASKQVPLVSPSISQTPSPLSSLLLPSLAPGS